MLLLWQAAFSSSSIGRDASEMSVSPLQNFSNPPPVPDVPTGTWTRPCSSWNSSEATVVNGATVLDPSILIVPDSCCWPPPWPAPPPPSSEPPPQATSAPVSATATVAERIDLRNGMLTLSFPLSGVGPRRRRRNRRIWNAVVQDMQNAISELKMNEDHQCT